MINPNDFNMLRFELEVEGCNGKLMLYKSFKTMHRGRGWGAARRWRNKVLKQDMLKELGSVRRDNLLVLNWIGFKKSKKEFDIAKRV